jgi:hypothetical protein
MATAFSLDGNILNLIVLQHGLSFLGQQVAQQGGFEDPDVAAPAEQPLQNLALLAYLERDEQTLGRLFFGANVVGASFVQPAGNPMIKEDAVMLRCWSRSLWLIGLKCATLSSSAK